MLDQSAKGFNRLTKRYIPMTETTFYMLLVLSDPTHGYGIKRNVHELTSGRINLGSGTIYGTLQKLLIDGLIELVFVDDRIKAYKITPHGEDILSLEIGRIHAMTRHETLWRTKESKYVE